MREGELVDPRWKLSPWTYKFSRHCEKWQVALSFRYSKPTYRLTCMRVTSCVTPQYGRFSRIAEETLLVRLTSRGANLDGSAGMVVLNPKRSRCEDVCIGA
jgi:hypothetical protein